MGNGERVEYDYLATGEVSAIRENGASSGVGVLGAYAYDDLGRRRRLMRGNGVVTNWTPDGLSRLTALANELAGASRDQTVGLEYNGVSQLKTRESDNATAYAFPDYAPKSQAVTPDALNRMLTFDSLTPGYDANGNLESDTRGNAYTYNLDNQLVAKTSGPALAYDPAGRLATIAGSATVRFDYDGVDMVAENDASGTLLRRYVHGPGTDEPLVWYEGSGTTDRRWLSSDERGSVTAISGASGNATAVNAYDEYGVPAKRNIGRFGYTGQTWLGELGAAPATGLWYYKARMYDPTIARFMQTDPIGYHGGMNLYAYVRGDSVNYTDPTGLLDPLNKWEWRCYGNCPVSASGGGYWNTGNAGLGTPVQRLEGAGWTNGPSGWSAPPNTTASPNTSIRGAQAGDIIVSASRISNYIDISVGSPWMSSTVRALLLDVDVRNQMQLAWNQSRTLLKVRETSTDFG